MADARTAPLIRSKYALRAIVTAITITTFTGMSAFAATHVRNANAPLQPAANAAITQATPAPTARTRNTNTGRVPTTNVAPLTRVHQS